MLAADEASYVSGATITVTGGKPDAVTFIVGRVSLTVSHS
jgi:hypothetical protein